MRILRIVSIAAVAAALTACGGETETAAPAPAESSAGAPAAAPEAEMAEAPASEASADTVYVDHSRDSIESAVALTKDYIEEFKAEGIDTGYLEEQLSQLEGQL